MKYIKTYESGYFSRNSPELTKKYEDKFFVEPVYMREQKWKKEDFYICLVDSIEIRDNPDPRYDKKGELKPHTHWPIANCFTVMKNGEIKNPSGWGYDYTKEEFNQIHFMTAQEFYNEYTEICEKLYLKVIAELEQKKCAEWYCEMLENYERVLDDVKELEYVKSANKYNL